MPATAFRYVKAIPGFLIVAIAVATAPGIHVARGATQHASERCLTLARVAFRRDRRLLQRPQVGDNLRHFRFGQPVRRHRRSGHTVGNRSG